MNPDPDAPVIVIIGTIIVDGIPTPILWPPSFRTHRTNLRSEPDARKYEPSPRSSIMKKVSYYQAGQFGFTNDPDLFIAVQQFIADAVVDGWAIEPTYRNSESIEQAARLTRDGFVIHTINRSAANGEKPRRWLSESMVHIWGPDGLEISTPSQYEFEEIKNGLQKCSECKRIGVKTERVGFAGRCCIECLPKLRAQIETPRWCDEFLVFI